MTSGDWLPAQAPFDLVRRGFSPEQVTAHLERLEYDLRITTANRDATNQRLTELGAQLAAAQAETDTLRAQLDRSALEPVSMANLSDRMQRMIRLAEEEAGEIRARAEVEADRLRSQLDASLAETAENRAAFDAERERTRKQLAEQVHGLIAEASAESADTKALAHDEAARLVQEASAQAEQELTEARAEVERITGRAQQAASQLTSETATERERLDAQSLARRTQTEEDFEIAITAKRLETTRVITERDEGSAAAAEKLVADARAHSEQLVATANAEADTLRQQATTYADALVHRAATESHQRVADADAAVGALQSLRAQLSEQLLSLIGHLDHIRELAGAAPALLAPPESEEGRPVSAEFPADPTERPTPTDLPVPVVDQVDNGDPVATTGKSPDEGHQDDGPPQQPPAAPASSGARQANGSAGSADQGRFRRPAGAFGKRR